MTKISFVILHYQNIDDTINCIDTIKNQNKVKNVDIDVIVVDNKSPNNSGTRIKQIYSDINNCGNLNIRVELLDKNYGFSYANNYGYMIAKNNHSDIIIISNNDILISDRDFIKKMLKLNIFENEIVYPDVINYNGYHQNPMREKPLNQLECIKGIIKRNIKLFLLYIPFIKHQVAKYFYSKDKKFYQNKSKIIATNLCVPIGAFIIYSKKWIDKEDKAFVSDTFMYCEEDMLALYIQKKKYTMKYETNLVIKHLEGRSVANSNNFVNSYRFKYKWQKIALKKYLSFIKS